MIRVILADDHHLVRQGIRSLLEKSGDIEIVAEAPDGEEAVRLCARLKPGVLITDINMPRLNGIQAVEKIRELALPCRVVILSMHANRQLVRQSLQNGAKGYVLKSALKDELLMAVRAAFKGATFLSPEVSEAVVTNMAVPAAPHPAGGFEQLSGREREILKLVAEGYTNKMIAQAMHLSIKTVEKSRAALIEKLGAPDLVGLIRIALKHGLIFLEDETV
jgi:DNA-binding NarL/FixJ family response regulator